MARKNVEVRRAGPADVEHLVSLAAAASEEDAVVRSPAHLAPATARDRLADVVARPDVEVHLVLVGDEPAGMVVLRVGELLVLTGGAAVRIEQLYVLPACRRRGIAHQLLAAALAAAERTGAEEVTCVVPSGGREAHRFLARLGFARLVTLRATPVARLRGKLAGEHERGRRRVALDALVARRRRQLDRPATPPVGMPAVPVAVSSPAGAARTRAGEGRSSSSRFVGGES